MPSTFFMYLRSVWMSSLSSTFPSISFIFIGLSSFFYWFVWVLYILWIWALCQFYICKYSHFTLWLAFHFYAFYDEHNFFYFNKYNYFPLWLPFLQPRQKKIFIFFTGINTFSYISFRKQFYMLFRYTIHLELIFTYVIGS